MTTRTICGEARSKNRSIFVCAVLCAASVYIPSVDDHVTAWEPGTTASWRLRARNAAVRDLLIDYLSRRSVEADYSTLDKLVRNLVQYFWKVVGDINPVRPTCA